MTTGEAMTADDKAHATDLPCGGRTERLKADRRQALEDDLAWIRRGRT